MNQEEVARFLHVPDRSTISRWTAKLLPNHQRGADYTQEEVNVLAARAAQAGYAQPAHNSTSARAEMHASVHENVLEMPIARALHEDMHETGGAQNRILARLEAIESKLDALMGLLSAAAIAPRYIQRKSVDDALSDLKPARSTKVKRGNGDVPRLSEFADLHGVPARTANDHARKWLQQRGLVKSIDLADGKQEHYVTPAQQAGVIAFWQSIGYPFKVCPLCPHAQEVQEHE